jgi:hypothetical protein
MKPSTRAEIEAEQSDWNVLGTIDASKPFCDHEKGSS